MRDINFRSFRGLSILLLSAFLLSVLASCGQGTGTPTMGAQAIATVAATAVATPTATTRPTETATATAPPGTPTSRPGPGTPAGSPTVSATATPVPPIATPPPPTPAPRAGQPVRLKIPVIRVDAAVEYVGLTPDGAMDVPKKYEDTAWYEPGPRPGEAGNAAIAGHVDSTSGKAVFWDLRQLKPGNEVFVVGDDGIERRFVVYEVQSYSRQDAPLNRIFGPSDRRYLNLITCDPSSTFDRNRREYAANIVVYTEYAP